MFKQNRVFSPLFKRSLPIARLSVALSALTPLATILLSITLLTTNLLSTTPTATAAPSTNLNFQARLLQNAGNVVPDGYYNIQFNLYNVSSGGSTLWTETWDYNGGSPDHRVRIVNGYLSAYLGSYDSLADETDINWNEELWLGMTVRGSSTCSFGSCTPADSEMTPRMKLTAVPYAFQAQELAKTSGANRGTLAFNTVANNPAILLPDASGTVCLQGASACGFLAGSGTAFLQGGNSFGVQGVLGTNDNNSLAFEINGTTRLVLDTSGSLQFQQASSISTSSGALTLQPVAGSNLNVTLSGTGDFAVNTNQLYVDTSAGNVGIGETAPGAKLQVNTGAAGTVGQIIKAAGSQTADLLQLQDSSGGILAAVSSGGQITSYGSKIRAETGTGSGLRFAELDPSGGGTIRFGGPGGAGPISATITIGSGGNSTVFSNTLISGSWKYSDSTASGGIDSSGGGVTLFERFGNVTVRNSNPGYSTAIFNTSNHASTPMLSILERAGGTNDLLQLQDSSGVALSSFNSSGQLVLGNDLASPQAGSITFNDGTGSNGLNLTLQSATLTGSSKTITLPNETGTVCLQSSSSCGFLAGSGTAFLQGGNTFSGTTDGDLGTNNNGNLNFRTNGTTKLTVSTAGNLTFAQASTISTTTGALTLQPVAGSNLNVTLSGTGDFAVNTDQLYVDTSAGNVGIGTATPNAKLSIKTAGDTSPVLEILHTNGSVALEVRTGSPGDSNIFIGDNAGQANTTDGIRNTALGHLAFQANTDGVDNVAVGNGALFSNIGGSLNTAVGISSLVANTSGTYNTALGANTLDSNDTGNGNTAVGWASLESVTGNSNNTALGWLSGFNITGANNIIVGARAGDELTSGSNNIVIGYDIDAPSATGSNQLNIGNLLFGTGLDGSDSTISSGKIGIGTTGPDRKLDVLDASSPQLRLTYTDGSVYADLQTNSSGYLNLLPSGNRVVLGVTGGTPTELVLGIKDTTGDPTGTEGSVYYNTFDNKFRCFQNTGWTDCIGSGITAVGAIDTQTKSANGAVISGNSIYLQTADASNVGLVSTGAQTFAGAKTFNGDITISGGGFPSILTFQNTASGTTVNDGVNFEFDNSSYLTIRNKENAPIRFQTNWTHRLMITADGALQFEGLSSAPAVSATNTGNLFFNSTSDLFQVSNSGGAYDTLCLQTLANCGGSSTLQQAYNTDADGSDAIIALTSADDSLIVRNPASSGTDSTFLATLEQLNTGAVDGLIVTQAGTGYSLRVNDDGTASDSTPFVIDQGGNVGIGTTTPDGKLDVEVDSSNALLVQEAGGVDALTVDTSSTILKVRIGDTSTANGTLLVLDSDDADPTGENGAQYYNTVSNTFRCFENSAWKDCAGAGASTTFQQAYDNSTTPVTVTLSSTDDSILFSNPTSSGTDLGYLFQTQNLATGMTTTDFKNLQVSSTGSFNTTSGNLTNYGLHVTNTSTESAGSNTLTNVGLYVTVSGGDTNYAAILQGGNVGIGTATPDGTLDIEGDSAIALLVQEAGGADALTVDTSGTILKVRVGDTSTSNGSLFVLDTDDAAPAGGENGAMYYDSTAAKFKCYENGAWRNCVGTSTKRITLVPEYPGSTFTADGAGNSGTMTSDFCSGSSRKGIPSSGNPCAATEEHNYYSWTSTDSNAADYDIWIRYQLPSDFNGFSSSSSINMYGWRTDSTTNAVDLSLYQADGTQCGSTTNVATGTAAWTETGLTGDETGCTFAANDVIIFKIKVTAASSTKVVLAGAIRFDYASL